MITNAQLKGSGVLQHLSTGTSEGKGIFLVKIRTRDPGIWSKIANTNHSVNEQFKEDLVTWKSLVSRW